MADQDSYRARVGLGSTGRLRRILVVATFFGSAMGVLLAHLILWPVRFEAGRPAHMTVRAPIDFLFVDDEKLAQLGASGSANTFIKILDSSLLDEALGRLDAFRLDILQARSDTGSDGGQESGKVSADELSTQHGVDQEVVTTLLHLPEQVLIDSFGSAGRRLAAQMSKPVTRQLIANLSSGGVTAVNQDPSLLYTYFLIPNLTDAPRPGQELRDLAQVGVPAGTTIVSQGEIVSPQAQVMLHAIEPHLSIQNFNRLGALAALLLGTILLWFQYLRRFGTPLLLRLGALVQYAGLFLAFLAIGILIARLPAAHSPYAAAFSVAALGSVIALIYDAAFGAYMALCLGAVLSVSLSFGPELMLFTVGGALLPSVVLTPGCRRGVQLAFALLMGGFNVILSLILSLAFSTTTDWHVLATAFAAGAGAAVVAFGLLPVLEAVSSQLTPGKLLELSNPENELLRRLKRDAHGTYAHCQGVADLAEEACKEIGANWRHARVGALYHDIGKLKRPGFFAENIHDLQHNPHLGLPPESSVKVLRDHVSDGIALAREHRLPSELRKYIAEHHGTYLIRYFFHQALALHKADQEGFALPQEEDFRYLGPLPSTRESGVVMLADVTEAVFRSKGGLEAEAMQALLDELFRQKIDENQLVECGLTIGDLAIVKASFLRYLIAQSHHRPAYPVSEEPQLQFHFVDRNLDLQPDPAYYE